VVKVGEMVFVGTLELGKLVSPRILGRQETGQLVFVELIGKPMECNIPEAAIVWEPTEKQLVDAYRESVSGLVMAKNLPKGNVVDIGGKK
jgi:hypothetical protein